MRYERLKPALLALLLLSGCGDSQEGSTNIAFAGGGGGGAGTELAATNALFNEDEVNDVHLDMAPADWQSLVADDRGDEYRHATLRWKNVTVSDIAVRPSGHATRFPGNQKVSLKLKFNEFVPKQKFLGLKTLKLDGLLEGTMMRERIVYGVFRALVPATPRAAHCKLFVNGEYRGLYLLEERVTDDLLEHRYGTEEGYLYRVLVSRPEAFAWRGTDPSEYVGERPFDPETHETDGDHSILPQFMDVLNHRPAELESVLDVENLIRCLALDVALVSRDGLLRDDGPPQNYFVVRRAATGRFEFLPWDVDQTLSTDRASWDLYVNFEKTRIAGVVRESPALNARFRGKLSEIIATLTHPDVLNPRIDFVFNQIRPHAHADPYKDETNSGFDGMAGYLKKVVRIRYDTLRAQLGTP